MRHVPIRRIAGNPVRMRPALLGIAGTVASALWWNSEVVMRLGPKAADPAITCLFTAGTGDCRWLGVAGLHGENQLASAIFYGGIALAAVSLVFRRRKTTK